MSPRKKAAKTGLDIAYHEAGIPELYHKIKYSNVIESVNKSQHNLIKKFLNNKLGGLLFSLSDYVLPYVIVRRLIALRLWLHSEARIVNHYDITQGKAQFSYENLFCIFRIDINSKYNKEALYDSILKANKNGSQLIIAATEYPNDIEEYLSNVDDLIRDNKIFGRIDLTNG